MEKKLIFATEGCVLKEVGAVGEGFAKLLLPTPATNLEVVAVEEDFRDREAVEFGGAGEMGVIEKAAGADAGSGERQLRRR